jgi:hypothetical protein
VDNDVFPFHASFNIIIERFSSRVKGNGLVQTVSCHNITEIHSEEIGPFTLLTCLPDFCFFDSPAEPLSSPGCANNETGYDNDEPPQMSNRKPDEKLL